MILTLISNYVMIISLKYEEIHNETQRQEGSRGMVVGFCTANSYGHVLLDMQEDAVDKMDQLFRAN